MILKASQRGGGKQLALHLLNSADNEHVELHELRGFVSEDLPGALKEAHAISQATKCRQYLFSVSLNPPQSEDVPVAVFEEAIRRIEEKTGLAGQPRAIVFHEKEGRRHAHCVWSRIDAEELRAINLPFFKDKLNRIARELYIEQGWTMPRGFVESAARDPRNYTLAEYQQARRLGREARDLKALMQDCWAISDSRAAFTQALKERGFILAKGDRRGHVAVTPEGEALSIARYVGKKAKEIRARLGEPDDLPGVAQAQAEAARDMAGMVNRVIGEARRQHAQAMAPLEARRRKMAERHRAERAALQERQKARWETESRQRAAQLRKGVKGLLDRITGRRGRIERQAVTEALAALKRDEGQRADLRAAQMVERRLMQADIRRGRDAHAGILRELRADRELFRGQSDAPRRPSAVGRDDAPAQQDRTSPLVQEFRLRADPTASPSPPTPQARLRRLEVGRPARQPSQPLHER